MRASHTACLQNEKKLRLTHRARIRPRTILKQQKEIKPNNEKFSLHRNRVLGCDACDRLTRFVLSLLPAPQ
jgi:hypothetical protein